MAEALDPERSGECEIEFRAGARLLSASGRAVFDGLRPVLVFGTLHLVHDGARPDFYVRRRPVALASSTSRSAFARS